MAEDMGGPNFSEQKVQEVLPEIQEHMFTSNQPTPRTVRY